MGYEPDALHVCDNCGHAAHDGRAAENHPCPFCGGSLRRYVRAPPGYVALDGAAALVAYRELGHTIDRTGGPDGFEVDQHTRVSATPLALARKVVGNAEARASEAGNTDRAEAFGEALDVLDEVGELTGEETNPDVDPLTSAVFDARRELADALDREDAEAPGVTP